MRDGGARGLRLNQQKLAVAFGGGSGGDIGFPYHIDCPEPGYSSDYLMSLTARLSERRNRDCPRLCAAGRKKGRVAPAFLENEEILLLHFVFFRHRLAIFVVFVLRIFAIHGVFLHSIFCGGGTGVRSSKRAHRGKSKSTSNQHSKQFLQVNLLLELSELNTKPT